MRFEQVQRFILAKKIFWGEGHFKLTRPYYWDFDVAPVSSNPKYMKIFQKNENRYA